MLSGELVQWNDARGFGFIVGDDGARYFVHISSIERMVNRPRSGDRVSFKSSKGKDGRPQASAVVIAGANPRPSREILQRGLPQEPGPLEWRVPVVGVMILLLAGGTMLTHLPWQVALVYALMGSLSFVLYGLDKNFAQRKQWRISEVTLLGIDLCFGIIGGLAGQTAFRHKTRKSGYVWTTVLLAGVHLLWLGGLASGLIDSREIVALLPL